MKLIVEENFNNIEFISEAIADKKMHYISGPFICTEVVNRNKRLYEKNMMEKVVNNYINDRVKNRTSYGELNHPQSCTINLDRACILVKELNWNGNNVIGKALITETPMGNIVKGLLESGGTLGVSTRGVGELKKRDDDTTLVQNYTMFAIADVVSDPSGPECFVRGIMENVEFFYDQSLGWRSEEVKKQIKKLSKKQIEDRKLMMFENYINQLSRCSK